MALLIREIMNRELFGVTPEESTSQVTGHLQTLGITTAPVLDDQGRPMGMVSLQNLIEAREDARVAEVMSRPPLAVRDDVSIEEAGRLLGETGFHHLTAIDSDGRAIGMVSALDVIRGLLGMPATHPEAFPHYDKRTGVQWTDDLPLGIDFAEAAVNGPGILALVHGDRGIPERVVWAESVVNVRARLCEMLTAPQEPVLAFLLEQGHLRFRSAAIEDVHQRQLVLLAS